MEIVKLREYALGADGVEGDVIDGDLFAFNCEKLMCPSVFDGLLEEVDYLLALEFTQDEFRDLFENTLYVEKTPADGRAWLETLKVRLQEMKPTQLERFVILNKLTGGVDTVAIVWETCPELFEGLVEEINCVLSGRLSDKELQKMFCERVDGFVPPAASAWLEELREELVPMDEVLFLPGWSIPKRRINPKTDAPKRIT